MRREVFDILNSSANTVRGMGMQGSDQSMCPLGIENQDTEQSYNAE